MLYQPEKYLSYPKDVNEELLKLRGELDDKEASLATVKFLRANIGLAFYWLTGIILAPYQEITIKAMLNSNFSLCVWCRGAGKSTIAAFFAILQSIFESGSKIVIAGPTFRTSRIIFNEIDRIVHSPEAKLLRDCIHKDPRRLADNHEWEINDGVIRAIPLNGEKIRGFRANVLIIDEFLLVPEETINVVLKPFLSSPKDLGKIMKVREKENYLISQGLMTEEERTKFPNEQKLIGLSSASYTVENLYRTYKQWSERTMMTKDEEILELKRTNSIDKDRKLPRFFVSQLSWEAIPSHMLNQQIIQEARQSGDSDPTYLREYCAQFSDGSDSFFNALKMKECTVKDGQSPTIQIFPKSSGKYIMAIDPSFSDSESSDNFSINIMEIGPDQIPTLVHNYAISGGHVKDHYEYFYYLYQAFKPEFIWIDNSGWEFIPSACETLKFKKAKIDIKFLDYDSSLEGEEQLKMIGRIKNQHNKENHCVAIKQYFTPDWIRKANEYLKTCIDMKRIRFASRLTYHDTYEAVLERLIKMAKEEKFLFKLSDTEDNRELMDPENFIAFQDDMIEETKAQASLIEITTNSQGTYQFKIPKHLMKDKNKNRIRRDSYTTLFLGNWGVKCCLDIWNHKQDQVDDGFSFMLV